MDQESNNFQSFVYGKIQLNFFCVETHDQSYHISSNLYLYEFLPKLPQAYLFFHLKKVQSRHSILTPNLLHSGCLTTPRGGLSHFGDHFGTCLGAFGNIFGSTREHFGIMGSTWGYLGILGHILQYLGILGDTWEYLGILWNSYNLFGIYLARTSHFRACNYQNLLRIYFEIIQNNPRSYVT